MDINKRITYKGWILEVIMNTGWGDEPESIIHFKKVLIKDISGMARTWLSGRGGNYFKSYMRAMQNNNLKRKRSRVFKLYKW